MNFQTLKMLYIFLNICQFVNFPIDYCSQSGIKTVDDVVANGVGPVVDVAAVVVAAGGAVGDPGEDLTRMIIFLPFQNLWLV